jgi:hypothetical protein
LPAEVRTKQATPEYGDRMVILKRTATAVLTTAMGLTGCAYAAADADFSGLVEIGPGRSLYLDCQGSGSPTVFVIPGKGSYAEAWNVAVPGDDPCSVVALRPHHPGPP